MSRRDILDVRLLPDTLHRPLCVAAVLRSACNGEYVVLQLLQTYAGPYIDFKSGQCGSNDSQAQDSRVAEHPALVQLYERPFLPLRRLFMSATPPLIFFRNFKHSCVLVARSVRFSLSAGWFRDVKSAQDIRTFLDWYTLAGYTLKT